LPTRVKCPRCATRFQIAADGSTALAASPPPVEPLAVTAQPAGAAFQQVALAPAPMRTSAAPEVEPFLAEAGTTNTPLLVGLIGGGVLLLALVIVVAVVAAGGDKEEAVAQDRVPGDSNVRVERNTPRAPANADRLAMPNPNEARAKAPAVNPQPQQPPPPQPQPQQQPANNKVNLAIDRGVQYLKNYSTNSFLTGGNGALAGLTLLSCGVPATDPAVTRILDRLRPQLSNLNRTYELAVCVWFLDKLNDPQDRDTIKTLALRLIASQKVNGGWDYTTFLLNDDQQKELLACLQNPDLVSRPANKVEAPKAPVQPMPLNPRRPFQNPRVLRPRRPFAVRPVPWNMPANVRDLPVLKYQPGQPLTFQAGGGHEDNSLTQFVILALWSAQKHGVPAERSLAMAEARFRASQNDDGSWAYTWNGWQAPRGNPAFPNAPRAMMGNHLRADSMTCAGLLGLAVGRAIRSKIEKIDGGAKDNRAAPPALLKDPVVDRGFTFLSNSIGKQAVGFGPRRGQGSLIRANSWGDLYYLWSLERVGVVYDLKQIKGKDWYAWGSEIIVDAQQNDGSWQEAFPGVTDTCFALLFLKRVNVVQDLTNKLQKLESVPVEPQPNNEAPKK
jgi:hypothetical protein